jgi:predicted GIY-YIG superfamily endonuclease
MKPFFLYMLRCRDGSYYVGHTDDLDKRIQEHEDGTCGGYTATRRPVELVFVDEFQTREDALARERQLKGWRRAKKEALICRDWDKLKVLARRYSALQWCHVQPPMTPHEESDA